MNVSTLEAPVGAATPDRAARASATTTVPVRPGRRAGRGTGPKARPARRRAAPPVVRSAGTPSHGCSVAAPLPVAPRVPRAEQAQWQLTDRGIALVLVTGLLIAAAALAVVGLTAIRVTSERYHQHGQSAVVQPVS